MQDWTAPVLVVALAALALALVLALLHARSRARQERAAARAETAALQAQLDDLALRVADVEPRHAAELEPGFLITDLGREAAEPEATPQIGGALFADIVVRETVVKAASFAHGVRRALEPETRNRIRFEMRREVRRARKQRRADLREARREWEARQRAADQGAAA